MRRLLAAVPPLDLVLAALITVWALLELSGDRTLGIVAALLVGVPLAVRRRYPLASSMVVGAGFVAGALQETPPEPLSQLAALLIAPFSLAAYAPAREAVAGGVALLAMGIAEVRVVGDDDYLFFAVILAASWTAGRLLGAGRRRAQTAEARAARLATERDQAVGHERERIARELHDVVAHGVTVMVMQAAAADELLATDPARARRSLAAVQESGRQAVADLQRLLGILRDDTGKRDPQPGLGQLGQLLEQLRASGLAVDARIDGAGEGLSPGIDLSAYRIVQETLTNALRHGAGTAQLSLGRSDAELTIEVTNPLGAGIRTDGTGHGLIGVRERVALYSGDLEHGAGGDGTYRVRVRLPV